MIFSLQFIIEHKDQFGRQTTNIFQTRNFQREVCQKFYLQLDPNFINMIRNSSKSTTQHFHQGKPSKTCFREKRE